MKWIGQHIYDLISRFRSDVYLEDISTGTIASGGNLGLDSDNKIVKATIASSSGDITGVTITTDSGGGSAASDTAGSADFSILGANGVGVTNSGTTITAAAVPGEIDHDSLNNFEENEHIDWTSGDAGTIHASNYTDTNTMGSGFTVSATTDSNATTITQGDDLMFTAGTGITCETTADGTVTITNTVSDTNTTYSAGTGLDLSTTTFSVDVSDFMTNGVDNRVLTATGADAMNAEANLTFDGNNLSIISASEAEPVLTLKTTHTTANRSGELQFLKDAADTEDNERLGLITFYGEDEGNNNTKFAHIQGKIAESAENNEGGKLEFAVASHDAGMAAGLTIVDGDADDEVDVTVGNGAASVTTIAGTLTMGSTAALGNDGLVTVANQSRITGLGTITSGSWQGTAIATDQQKHLAHFCFKGYATGDGTNYEMQDFLSDTNAPYEHNTSIGSDGLTATTQQVWMRTGGTVMPRAGTLKNWTGWAASAGSGTVDIGLFKVTPSRNTSSSISAVLLKNTQFSALGNAKLEDFAETSFSVTFAAGDMIVSAVKNSSSGKICYFSSTLEVEWD